MARRLGRLLLLFAAFAAARAQEEDFAEEVAESGVAAPAASAQLVIGKARPSRPSSRHRCALCVFLTLCAFGSAWWRLRRWWAGT
jgi:hypothetical protein